MYLKEKSATEKSNASLTLTDTLFQQVAKCIFL